MPRSEGTTTGTTRAGQDEWPFHGRAAELEVVLRALSPDGDEGGGRGTVVVAPPGVGKSRLLRETRRAVTASGLPTATVIATEAAALTPYGAVLHLLPEGVAGDTDRSGWHAAFASALRTGDRDRPTVLLVDDAQHLDEGSAALLLNLTLQGVVVPVVAVRAGAPVPEPVTLLWKNGLCQRVDLQPLTAEELGELIGRVLGGRVSGRALARLAEVSDGNVLYAHELVTAAVEAGSLRSVHGVWGWDEQVVLAPRLVDAVDARLATLDEDERRALALVALADPLPSTIAERLTGPAPLEALETARLVRVSGSGAGTDLRLAHPLYGEVVLQRTGHLGRRRLVAALADAFESDPDRLDPFVVRVASWRVDAGLPTDWRTLHHAAERANQTFDHQLAARLGRSALEVVDEVPTSRAVVSVELARALIGCNAVAEADALLADVEGAVLDAADDSLLDAYVDSRFYSSYFGLGRAADTAEMFDRLARRPGARGALRRAAAYRACLEIGEGRPQQALDLTGPLLGAAEVPLPQQHLALSTTGEAEACLGRPERAERAWDGMRELSRGVEGRTAVAATHADLQALFFALLDGRVTDALPAATALHARLEQGQDVVNRGLACMGLGRCLLLAGRVDRARVVLMDALSDFRRMDLNGSLAWTLALLSQVASLTGNAEEGRRWLEQAVDASPRAGTSRLQIDLVGAQVWLAVAEGDHSRAAALALAGADRYPELPLTRACLLHLAYRVGDRSGEVVRALREVATSVDCGGPSVLADHAAALRSADGRALESVATEFHSRGLTPLATEAALDAARAHRQAGSTDGVNRSAARAAALVRDLDPIVTPALTDPARPPVLSRRELDVARLAASGMTNAAIAERLTVSVRTVESHLYQAFAKLGVRSRTELGGHLPTSASPPADQ